MDADTTAARANVYRILADCFREPRELDAGALEQLPAHLDRVCPEAVSTAAALTTALRAAGPGVMPLRVDHARLFVGPAELLAPPFGSVYLDGEYRVNGPSTLDAERHYSDAGLHVESATGDPADYICTELEFMYYLAFEDLNGEKGPTLAEQHAFLTQHLGRWAPDFTDAVERNAEELFYKALASVLKSFVASDIRMLGSHRGSF